MSANESAVIAAAGKPPWYRSVTRYQWTVLILASLGWIFDVFEGQIFVASMNEAMPSFLPAGAERGDVAFYNNLAFGAFLLGGALGGVVFGIVSDRIGRKKALTYTILVYSAFTCVSALARTWWQMTLFRFLVAMGTGGEWAVAAALVAEVFPLQANLPAIKRREMLGLLLIVTGGGAGLVAFGPLCERLGRRGAFLLFQLGGLVSALVLFQWLTGVAQLLVFLPIFGFLTLGMHAGYAIYFPELFPTRLRSTGAGFCFNVGRVLAAPILFLSGWMQKDRRFTLANACSVLSLLFVVGIVLLAFAPETRGQDLSE
jgi:MFS family permease